MLNVISGMLNGGAAPDLGAYEAIQTYTVGAGGATDITFSSIPSTFKHLQLRGLGRSTTSSAGTDALIIQFNGDATYTNYRTHLLYGDGATANAAQSQSSTYPGITYIDFPQGLETTNAFGVLVADILDYTNTNKNKTARILSGYDGNNSNGTIRFSSGLWLNTAAVTTVTIKPRLNKFAEYSQFALYGIKG